MSQPFFSFTIMQKYINSLNRLRILQRDIVRLTYVFVVIKNVSSMPSVDWNIQFKRKSFRTSEFYFDNRHCFWQGIFFWLTVLIIKNVMAEISHITQNPLDICYTGISYSISVLQSIFSQKRLRQHFETKTIFLSLNFTRDKKTFL